MKIAIFPVFLAAGLTVSWMMYYAGYTRGISQGEDDYSRMLRDRNTQLVEALDRADELERDNDKLQKHLPNWAPSDYQPCLEVHTRNGTDYFFNVHVWVDDRGRLIVRARSLAGSFPIATYNFGDWDKYVDVSKYPRENHGPLDSDDALREFSKKQDSKVKPSRHTSSPQQ